MRFGIYVSNFGDYHDARVLAQLAHDAESAGWDGMFLWDHIQWTLPISKPTTDPWIAFTAMALATKRLSIGALVTPLPRRRPWKLARETVALDHLFGREGKLTPNDYQAISDVILAHRGTLDGFDIICEGRTDGTDSSFDAAQIAPYARAGVTWWLEHATEGRDSLADMQARIQRGPPVLT